MQYIQFYDGLLLVEQDFYTELLAQKPFFILFFACTQIALFLIYLGILSVIKNQIRLRELNKRAYYRNAIKIK